MGLWKPVGICLSLALVLLAPLGCQKVHLSSQLVEVVVQAPIKNQLEAPGFQQRILPWDNTNLSVSAPMRLYPTETEEVSLQFTPGLFATEQRFQVRAKALEDLSQRLAVLPAAEAPPGESMGPRMMEFSRDFPRVEQVIKKQFENGFLEQLRVGRGGNAVLVLDLPLRPIAQAVLDHGGGFTPEHEVSRELSAVSLAKKQALQEARNRLREELYARPVVKDTTYGDWAQLNAMNFNRVEDLIKSARIEQSEEVKSEEGQSEWMMKLALDPSSLNDEIKLEVDVLKDISSRKKDQLEESAQ
jgi:hypothetical protein